MSDFTPRLYIMIPMDIPDGNPGKMMAQAAHAQALFTKEMDERGRRFNAAQTYNSRKLKSSLLDSYNFWIEEGGGFGTTIVLSCLLQDISSNYKSIKITCCGKVIDPTYPWRNFYGEMFVKEQLTAGWAFVTSEEEAQVFSKYKLHR